MRSFTARELECIKGLARALLPDGFGPPGAGIVGVSRRLDERALAWDPAVRGRVRWLLRAWDLSPVPARRRRFSSLAPDEQLDWVAAGFRSRPVARRLMVAGLKQLILLTWASTPEIEDELGYDYRCRRDDEPHGAGRIVGDERPAEPSTPEPSDYHRPGPAIASGAIPLRLLDRTTFEPRPEHDHALTTEAWPDLFDGQRLRADVVVVGSGAGGAVVAATLAEAGLSVVVVEEGPQVEAERDFEGPVFDRFQRFCRDNGTTQVWGTPPIPLPLGKVVGGTTVVNSGTCFRSPDRVLRRWESEHGVDGVSGGGMTPYFEAVEDFLNVRPVPWAVLGPNGAAAHRGAVALGMSGGPLLRNIADCHGCGQCAFGCPTNAKQAMHVSYLPRAQRAGVRIVSRCRVDRVTTASAQATGVVATLLAPDGTRRGTLRVDADHVVVSAGAVHTPALLDASGVPDASGQTGRNLRIHPATGVGGFFDDDIVSWKGTLQSYYIDALFDTHEIMFEATATIPSVGAGSVPGFGAQMMGDLADMRRMVTLGFYVSDTSRGRVRRLPNGDVLATYHLNDLDTRRIGFAIAVAAEVLLAAGAKRVHPGLPSVDAVHGRAQIEALKERATKPGHLRLTAFHPMGTARMGEDPARSVVDPFGRHHGVRNLWVADASTFPSCVGVNPQITIMAFAMRTAERLVDRAG